MKNLFFILILLSVSSCRTQKTAVSSEIHAEYKECSSVNSDSISTTEIIWRFSNDSILTNNPSYFNLIRIAEAGDWEKTIPKAGYIKVTSASSSSTTAAKNSFSDTAWASQQNPPPQSVIYKNNWLLTAALSVLTFIFCQCWQYRKKIAKIFARFK